MCILMLCIFIFISEINYLPTYLLIQVGRMYLPEEQILSIFPNIHRQDIVVTFFGYYIWLQSDAAFYYPRLDKCSFSVGMFVLRAMSHVGHSVA